MSACYEDILRRIRCTINNNNILMSTDETVDVYGKYVANAGADRASTQRTGRRVKSKFKNALC
jgi:hypothetical protein